MSKMHGCSDLHLLFYSSTQFSSRWYLCISFTSWGSYHPLQPVTVVWMAKQQSKTVQQCPILQAVGQTVTPLQTHPVAMSHPSRRGTDCDSTTNTSCSNVPSFKVWDRLWLHYKPTHPVAMSYPSRRGTDCDSTTNQQILKQCPILQGMGQTVTPIQTHPVAMSHPSRHGTDCDSTTNQHIL